MSLLTILELKPRIYSLVMENVQSGDSPDTECGYQCSNSAGLCSFTDTEGITTALQAPGLCCFRALNFFVEEQSGASTFDGYSVVFSS